MPGHVLIVDGKTGRRRDADFFQVLVYLYARLHQAPHEDGIKLAGEVFYKQGRSVDVRVADVERHTTAVIQMVQAIASPNEPTPNPSRFECDRCNIRREDCPQRFQKDRDSETIATGAF
jgi:hypothetical protein